MHRLPLSEAAALLGYTADQVRRRAQTGDLERAAPIDGKASVTFRSVAQLAAELGRSLDDGQPLDLADFDELRERVTKYHVLGIERAAFLRQLEADALACEQHDQLATAAMLWQLAAGLARASYAWNPATGAWACTVPGIGVVETAPTVGATAPVESEADA